MIVFIPGVLSMIFCRAKSEPTGDSESVKQAANESPSSATGGLLTSKTIDCIACHVLACTPNN